MESMRLDLEGWCKTEAASKSVPVNTIQFTITEEAHQRLEAAEEALQSSSEREMWLDVDLDSLDLETAADCGELGDARLRVYLNPGEERAHFHLVGHRASDNALVYSNPVMVDMLI